MSAPPPAADGQQPAPYDRWSLLDPSTIDYGCFAGSNNGSPPSPNTNASTSTSEGSDKKKKGFYITTAINYTNGPAHMGHAYEAATTDAIARFARLNSQGGDGNSPSEAYFVTGADEHGEKIAKTAEKEEKEPIDICNKVCSCRCCCDCVCQVVCSCMAMVLYGLYWTIWTFT